MSSFAINNNRTSVRNDFRSSRASSSSSSSSGMRGVLSPQQDDCIDLKCGKSNSSTSPELMGMSRNKAMNAFLHFGKEEAEANARTAMLDAMEKNKKALSNLGKKDLTPEQQQKVKELKKQEDKVMQRVNARLAAGGDICERPTYQYKLGPDGVRYKVAGEVKIDISPCKTPEETIAKMQRVKKAAMSSPEPSPDDRAIYDEADRIAQMAQAQLVQERALENKEQREKREKEIAERRGDADKTRKGGKVLRALDKLPPQSIDIEQQLPKPQKPQVSPSAPSPSPAPAPAPDASAAAAAPDVSAPSA